MYKTMYMASLGVKTAFDVAKPLVVSKTLSLIGACVGRDAGRERFDML